MMSARLRSWPARVAVVTALAVGAAMLTLLPGGSPTASAAGLVPWDDCDAMLGHYRAELSRSASAYGVGGGSAVPDLERTTTGGAADTAVAAPGPATGESSATGGAVGTGPTGTNLQEAGVDEPDTAKLAGDLLVVTAGGQLQVLRAGASPQVLAALPLGDGASGGEVLVDGDRVLVLSSGWRPLEQPEPEPTEEPAPTEEPVPTETATPQPVPTDPSTPEPTATATSTAEPTATATTEPGPTTTSLPGSEPVAGVAAPPADVAEPAAAIAAEDTRSAMIGIPAPGTPIVRLALVDLSDPAAPRLLESLELDGRYLSARLVDGTVRLVTASSPQVVGINPVEPYGSAQEQQALRQNRAAAEAAAVDDVLPRAVRLGPDGEEVAAGPAVECTAVQHAEAEPVGVSTLLVTTLRPASGLGAVDSTAVTTDGDLVYASAERLYVATSRWGTVAPASGDVASGEPTTQVHAFDTSSVDRTRYVGSGSVRGYVYGRWALSEHEGDLRVATTLQPPWDGGGQSSSSVVVLGEQDGALVERGRLDGLGKDERIFAVRYFGDIATVVTFRQTDPLYVLDLGDPTSPRLLGELKIPGFSTYLHPVGDDRLLGIGQDADPATGQVTGFQLSLFDLSDLANPVQVDRLSLGEGYSPASDDSRAFGYDPARRLAVLPFTSYTARGGSSVALGVRVTEDFRLEEVGRLDAGTQSVDRVLLGGDLAYAVTPYGVVAAETSSMRRVGSADFLGVPEEPGPVPLPEPRPDGPIPDGPIPVEPGPGGPAAVDPDCSVSSDGPVVCVDGGGSSGSAGSSEPGAPGTG